MGLEIHEAGVGLGGGVSVIIKTVLFDFSLLNPSSCKLEGVSFLREDFMYVEEVVSFGGLINTKLLQKNLSKTFNYLQKMLTCLTLLNYVVTARFSAYPNLIVITFSDGLVGSLSQARYVINWASAWSLLKTGVINHMRFLFLHSNSSVTFGFTPSGLVHHY